MAALGQSLMAAVASVAVPRDAATVSTPVGPAITDRAPITLENELAERVDLEHPLQIGDGLRARVVEAL